MIVVPDIKDQADALDRAILILWKSRTQDTVDIAKHLGLTEAQVANRLLHLRGQSKQTGG